MKKIKQKGAFVKNKQEFNLVVNQAKKKNKAGSDGESSSNHWLFGLILSEKYCFNPINTCKYFTTSAVPFIQDQAAQW